jgi:hypothetical protein
MRPLYCDESIWTGIGEPELLARRERQPAREPNTDSYSGRTVSTARRATALATSGQA